MYSWGVTPGLDCVVSLQLPLPKESLVLLQVCNIYHLPKSSKCFLIWQVFIGNFVKTALARTQYSLLTKIKNRKHFCSPQCMSNLWIHCCIQQRLCSLNLFAPHNAFQICGLLYSARIVFIESSWNGGVWWGSLWPVSKDDTCLPLFSFPTGVHCCS